MDRWKYVLASGRKESGFENLKTRFQDCNLSRKQESKPDGMIERKQSFNRESKLSAKKTSCLCGMNERNKESEKEVMLSFELSTWNERKHSVCQSERMENNKDVSQNRIITMKKETLYVAFSTQKGGVGKTTFTVLVASYLYYLKGYNVAVVDCDYPQHSISAMRKRDAEQVNGDEYYKQLAFHQFKTLGKKAYPVLCSSPDEAIKTADEFLASAGMDYDVVFFDLPGTVNSEGVINSLSGVDYIFTPITADRVVLESSLSFAVAIHKLLVKSEACRLKGLHLFWNMVDGREKTDLYTLYEQTIGELELPLMKVFIPDTKRFKKELDAQRKTVFRSTLFPADKRLVKGSNMEELITEIAYLIKL